MNIDAGETAPASENENQSQVHILEVGPSHGSLAGRFYDTFSNPRVVFVAAKKESDFSTTVSNSTFVEADIMDYVQGDRSIPPTGFDFIVVQNVVSAPVGKLNDLNIFARGLGTILKSGGKVIIEETYSNLGTRGGQRIAEYFQKNGFTTEVTNEESRFIGPRETWHAQAFHLEAIKA